VTPVDADQFQFPTAELRATQERWETAVKGMRQDDWFHQGWYRESPKNFGALTWWSTAPELANSYGQVDSSINGVGFELLQGVQIKTSAKHTLLEPQSIALTATWHPQDKWGAFLYLAKGETWCSTCLTFSPRGFAERQLNFYPELTRWQSQRTVNDIKYNFHLPTNDQDARDRSLSGELSLEQLVDWYESPEALRDGGFALLDRLEASAREFIPSGKASRASVSKMEGGDRSDNPPRYFDQPIDVPLDEAVMTNALEDCLTEIAARRALLEKHYKEMHTALVNVFPKEALLP
jgi:hypothetical protein